jgi:excinuclease UvrABC nuclease subunit
VDCELDALLLESERIRALEPPYNVQGRTRRGLPFLRFEAGPFTRVSPAERVAGDGNLYAGPYRTTQAVRHTIQTVRRVFQLRACRRRLPATRAAMRVPCLRLGQALCPAPCADLIQAEHYETLVQYARLFVTAGKEAALEALDARLRAMEGLDACDGWEYAMLRECRRRLVRVRQEYRPLEGGSAGGALVMAYPAADGGLVLFFVEDGRLCGRSHLPPGGGDAAAVHAALAKQLAGPPAHGLNEEGTSRRTWPGGAGAAADGTELDADQANILLRWIYQHSGQRCQTPVVPGTRLADVAAAIVDGVLQADPGAAVDGEAAGPRSDDFGRWV